MSALDLIMALTKEMIAMAETIALSLVVDKTIMPAKVAVLGAVLEKLRCS